MKTSLPADRLLDIRRIYLEPAAAELPRGREVLARFPAAQIVEGIGAAAKAQLAAEVIFLTHNRDPQEVNLGWHPKGEELIRRPELQQPKRSQNGSWNVRYRTGRKGEYVTALLDLIAARTPYCHVRYAF